MSCRSRAARAFGMLEVVFSIGLFALIALTVIALATNIIQSGQKSTDTTVGTLAAQRVLDQVLPVATVDPNFWNNDYVATPYQEDTVTLNRTDFKYKLYAQDLGATTIPDNRMKKVDVVVTWWDADVQERTGYGELSTSLSQIAREQAPSP